MNRPDPTSAKGQEPGRGVRECSLGAVHTAHGWVDAGGAWMDCPGRVPPTTSTPSIEERWKAVEKAVAVYGMAEADVMGVPEVMPEVAVKAAADLRNAQLALALAVLDEAERTCWKDYVGDGPIRETAKVRALRGRIKAL